MESYFENQSTYIIREIKQAKTIIKIAVAWITDSEIINELIISGKKGVDIEILTSAKIFSNNYKKKQIEIIQALKSNGNCKVYRIGSETNDYKSLMHHKFSVIDEKVVITGSYNWTKKAHKNNEDIIIINNIEIASKYINQFEKLKKVYLTKDRLWFNNLSLNWQKELLENINQIDDDFEDKVYVEPSDLELNKILKIKKLELSNIPSSMRKEYEDDYFNELIETLESPSDIDIKLARILVEEFYCSIKDLTPIQNLKSLEYLSCSGIDIETIEPIKNNKKIKELYFSYNDKLVTDLKVIKSLINLEILSFGYERVKNYNYLENFINLRSLIIYSYDDEVELNWLRKLTKLKEFSSNLKIQNLEHILNLKELAVLGIQGAEITDLTPLYNLKNLRELTVNQSIIKEKDYIEFTKKYPLEY